jgi:hypothetical protein
VSLDSFENPGFLFFKEVFILVFNQVTHGVVRDNFIKITITSFDQELDLVVVLCIVVFELS